MRVNIDEIVECGDKLYYDINPGSQKDVPSMFYVRLEREWVEWKESESPDSFYDFCKKKLNL